jgi:hypothetical protein
LAQVAIGDLPEDAIPVKTALVARALGLSESVVMGTVGVLLREGVLEDAGLRGDGMIHWQLPVSAIPDQPGGAALLRFMDALARQLPREAFRAPTPIRIASMARSLKIAPERLLSGLAFLSARGVLSFTSFADQPWVRLRVPRSRRLALDLSELNRSARMLERKRSAVERYLTSATCRMQFVMGYFGQPTLAVCGRCDVCAPALAPSDEALAQLLAQAATGDGAQVGPGDSRVDYLHQEGLVTLTDPLGPRIAITDRGRRWLRSRMGGSGGARR